MATTSSSIDKHVFNKSKQKGVVLVVSLVFLVALTAVAGALMQNTSVDMKMAGASQTKSVATQELISALDQVIEAQVEAPSGENEFAQPLVTYADDGTNVKGDITIAAASINSAKVSLINNQYKKEPDCPHSRQASSAQVFTCSILRVNVNKNYGRKNNSNLDINSGIAQQLLR